jgi:crotonobetainyl-CoA:carnitine CoA-transferase CaiB-like acyl-CoA transferase
MIGGGPLAGVRVADFTIHAAGPFCTHVLSQLGAECIKIESRARPDAFRKPHAVYGRLSAATFDQVSANKRSIRLNLKKAEAVTIAKQIVALSDVAAESFRAGVMQRLGLDFDALKAVKSDLIMLSLSSCGQEGPDSHFAGYAPLFGAWGGLGYQSGYADGPPIEMRHVMDHSTGYHAAVAIMAALLQRRATGASQYIDLAAREVSSAMIGDALVQAAVGETPSRLGNASAQYAPHGVYRTLGEDQWLSLVIQYDEQWGALLDLLSLSDEHRLRDPVFQGVEGRLQRAQDLDQALETVLKQRPAEDWAALFQSRGIAAYPSVNMQAIADNQHLQQRGSLTRVSELTGSERWAVGSPVRFSQTPAPGVYRTTPDLGEAEDYVYGELLGMSSRTRKDLEAREVIY